LQKQNKCKQSQTKNTSRRRFVLIYLWINFSLYRSRSSGFVHDSSLICVWNFAAFISICCAVGRQRRLHLREAKKFN